MENPPKSYFSFATMKDYIDRTKSIWEKVTGTMIEMKYDDDHAYVTGDATRCQINLPDSMPDGEKKIKFNHESAHIIFDSLIGHFNTLCAEQYTLLPLETQKMSLEREIKDIFRDVLNVIDDERIESLMGEVYYGTGLDFQKTLKEIGSKMKEPAINPIDAIYCARFGRPDLIDKKYRDDAMKAMEDVRMTEKEGTIIVSNEYIKKHVSPYIIKNLPPNMPIPPVMQALMEAFSGRGQSCDHKSLGKALKYDKNKSLEDCKADGITRVGDVKDDIEKQARTRNNLLMPDADKIDMVNRDAEYNDYVIDYGLANGLNKILRNIQAKRKPKLKDSGDTLSIPAVIQRKAQGYGDKLFIDNRRVQHMTLTISIDASGSMSGYPLDTARDMVATMYKAIDGIKGIHLNAVVWGGGRGNQVGITNITNIKQCKAIRCHDGYGGTPTPYAVEYSVREIERMKGKNKLLIVITDGCPNGVGEGYRDAYQITYDEVKRARNKKIGVFGVFIGAGNAPHMQKLFGKQGYMCVTDMKEGSSRMLTKFRDLVLAQVKHG